MEWIIHLLRQHSELAIFLTIAAGFWIGKMKIKQFSLGIVTSVLLVGVLVGQLNITIEEPVKSVFFFYSFCYRIQSGTTILSRTEKRWFTSSRIRRAHVYRLFDYHLVISHLNGI